MQPYVRADKIDDANMQELMAILESAFGNGDKIGTTSNELDTFAQGSKEFSVHYAAFQCLMVILKYDTNAKKASLEGHARLY